MASGDLSMLKDFAIDLISDSGALKLRVHMERCCALCTLCRHLLLNGFLALHFKKEKALFFINTIYCKVVFLSHSSQYTDTYLALGGFLTQPEESPMDILMRAQVY